jgi:ferric-dicitrate binding protein FerR (iron transport regulator)
MNDSLNFVDFTSNGLASNESFQAYVFRQNQEDIIFWENFISAHPAKQAAIIEAIETLSLLTFKKHKNPERLKELEFNELLTAIAQSGRREETPLSDLEKPHRRSFLNWVLYNPWYKVAAGVSGLLIALSAILYFSRNFFENKNIEYETQYGENASFILPDRSRVILNGNTRLTYRHDWDEKGVREVWLDGEAFFDVTHQGDSPDARFIVHTPGMDVEVLGTRFNVFNRADKANVILNSGTVKVKIGSDTDTTSVVMKPDEAVEFLRKDQLIIKKQVKAEVLTSWRNRAWVFENTPLYTIGEMIEDTYGIKVLFRSNVDVSEGLAGTIPSENLEVLLTVLAKSSGLLITKNENEIIIEKNPVTSQQ